MAPRPPVHGTVLRLCVCLWQRPASGLLDPSGALQCPWLRGAVVSVATPPHGASGAVFLTVTLCCRRWPGTVCQGCFVILPWGPQTVLRVVPRPDAVLMCQGAIRRHSPATPKAFLPQPGLQLALCASPRSACPGTPRCPAGVVSPWGGGSGSICPSLDVPGHRPSSKLHPCGTSGLARVHTHAPAPASHQGL